MDHYSQPHLKKAATEPEHVIRKAEFDFAVEAIDERIVVIEKTLDVRPGLSGGVLSGKSAVETSTLDDAVSSPFPTSTSENTRISDDFTFVKTLPLIGNTPTEESGLGDSVTTSLPNHLSETASLDDETRLISVSPLHSRPDDDLIAVSDAVQIHHCKGQKMENLKLQGEIEVVLEDRDGKVKERQVVSNAITEAYERYVFYDMLNAGTLSSLLRSNTRSGCNFLTRTLPSVFGLYAMNHDIDIKRDTFLPPYVGDNQTSLADNVSFYNVGGSATESTQEMIPVDQRCYFDKAKKEFVLEYVKNTGVGTVKSVCVGRTHSIKADKFSVALAETAVPATWQNGNTNYLLEHTTDATCLWKINGTTAWRNNLVTRSTEAVGGTACAGVVGSYFGGLVAGNVVYKAAKQSASGANHVVRLTYINNFRTSGTTAYKDITFTCREGMTVNTAMTPVMVMRPDRNKLEIFVTLSVGDHDGTIGCNLQKAVIGNLDDPANLTVEIEDLRILPYAVSNWSSASVGYHLNGFFHEGKYYLPVYGIKSGDEELTVTAEAAFQTGVVVSSDFSTVHNSVNFRTATSNEVNAFVLTDGGVVQCRVNATTIPYVHLSQVLSGSNLPQAVTKNVDDVLRIIYRYKLS